MIVLSALIACVVQSFAWENDEAMNEVIVVPIENVRAARECELLGATVIAVRVTSAGNGIGEVSLEVARDIRESLDRARFCLIANEEIESSATSSLLDVLRPEFVAIDLRKDSYLSIALECEARGIGVVAYGVSLDYDEDPAWGSARIAEAKRLHNFEFVVLTLVPGVVDPFLWFMSESGKHAEDVSILDVKSVVGGSSVLVNVDLSTDVERGLLGELSLCDGVFFFLGDSENDGSVPVLMTLGSVLDALPGPP